MKQKCHWLGELVGYFALSIALRSAGIDLKPFFAPCPVAAAISPSGEWLAFATHEGSHYFIYSRSIVSQRSMKRDMGTDSIDQLSFLNDAQIIYRQTIENKESLAIVDITTENTVGTRFTPPEIPSASIPQDQPSSAVSKLLYFELKSERDHLDGLFSLPIPRTGPVTKYDFTEAIPNPLHFQSWIFDPRGKILGGIARSGSSKVLYLSTPDSLSANPHWRPVFTETIDDFPGFYGFACPPGFLFVSHYFNGNYSSGVLFNTATREFGSPVISATGSDIWSSDFSPDLSRIDLFSTSAHPEKEILVSAEVRKSAKIISSILGGDDWTLTAWAQGYAGALILQQSDARPPKCWHIDLKRKKGYVFAEPSQAIDIQKLHHFVDMEVTARDGLAIHCYQLGLQEAAKSSPLIVFLEGGPFIGIHREWTPRLQALALQGNVVVIVDYRGATEFGKAYEQAGFAQANRAMIDDVEDVVGNLERQSIYQNRKVILVCESFGGYLGLKTLARKNVRVDGLVLINPVVETETIFKAGQLNGEPLEQIAYQKQKWFGPLSSNDWPNANDISNLGVPTLIAQSLHDEKVSSDIVHNFAKRALAAGSQIEYLPIDDVHEIDRPESSELIMAKTFGFIQHINETN